MTEHCDHPYMKKLLENLGWDQGTRIPLANPENQVLENFLIDRQNEIQRLKEELLAQKQKREDIDKYKQSIFTESQENTRILFAQKHQLEQEVKLRQLAVTEADWAERDLHNCLKKRKEFESQHDRFTATVTKLLKRADELKNEVCAEKGALTEWRAVIDRGAGDIAAIEQFTKQDCTRAKNLEVQRQKLKTEHDRLQERLKQLVANINSEETSCERVSSQVVEGIRERQRMMTMWQGAVENLRQRDNDIRHIREDYFLLEDEAKRAAELCREQQNFYDQQHRNNLEAEREIAEMLSRIGNLRVELQRLAAYNVSLDSELKSLQRELSSLQNSIEKLRAENRYIMDKQHKLDMKISSIHQKIRDLKMKAIEALDKSKSAEKRAKQLEEMLNDEEQYATALTKNQQQAMHCSFIESQKLLELKNESKLFHMQMKESTVITSKLESKKAETEKKLQSQKETLYSLCYQVETIGTKVLHMEGGLADRSANAELAAKEKRLKEVLALHMTRVGLLERHSARLDDDMRRLTREIEVKNILHTKMQSDLKSSILTTEGGNKELKEQKDAWRRDRVEESLVKLRVAHAARAVAGIEDAAFSLDKQRFQLDAAMNERLIEIATRKDLFGTHKRALTENCSRLRGEIKERELRITQLIKRYEIFIASLGKDEAGQQVAPSYFQIKFAAERAELRERGAALDVDIGRREREVSALEATVRVIACAHLHFMHSVNPLADDTPEIEELRQLTEKYYMLRDELKVVRADVSDLEICVSELSDRLTMLQDKNKQLISREADAEAEVESGKERVVKQEARLQTAHEVVRHHYKRAKKLIDGVDDWRMFQIALWVRDLSEASHNALHALKDACGAPSEVRTRFAELLAATDLQRHMGPQDRRLRVFVQSVIDARSVSTQGTDREPEESVFSSSIESDRSGVSQASGFTRRFAQFRKVLAHKVQEPIMAEEISEKAKRSTLSLRVITLGLEESIALLSSSNVMTTARKTLP